MNNTPEVIPVEESEDVALTTERLLLRPAAVARALSISRSRCYSLIAQGHIPAIRLGKSIRITTRQLDELVRRLETEHAVVSHQPDEDGS